MNCSAELEDKEKVGAALDVHVAVTGYIRSSARVTGANKTTVTNTDRENAKVSSELVHTH
jgi:hypothetical protein